MFTIEQLIEWLNNATDKKAYLEEAKSFYFDAQKFEDMEDTDNSEILKRIEEELNKL